MNTPDPEQRSRYVVGIDLGTTNSALCYVDTQETAWRVRTFGIPQLIAPGHVERRETLPSFHYEPAAGELPLTSLRLPWSADEPKYGVGVFAREQGRVVPGRLIESAKSWLCHSGIDRRAALLPWHGAPDVERLSPVEVSARYLRHLRDAWNADFPNAPLSEQDVVLTIPASFDEVARELTVAAARSAGLPRSVLIEEPQAAFYSWVDAHRDDWQQHVSSGQKILICDIGGGTTDFTLIHVRRGQGDKLQFHRVAVGDHLILGGDNLDLALAHHVERKLMGDGRLEPRQWSVLVPTCRHVKESLLSGSAPERMVVTLPGTGARLIGGSLQAEITRDEVIELLVEGFLPHVAVDEKPKRRQSGFQEFGLPYAPDPAITRYLAVFLVAHAGQADVPEPSQETLNLEAARPDIVLFNGGFFASPILRGRLLEVLESWFSKPNADWSPVVLKNERLDLAVARGAAYFGMVRRGLGVRITARLARTYYVGVERETRETSALCLIPAGSEPSADLLTIDREFQVRTAEPVEFPILASSTRTNDQPGSLVPIDAEQMTALPPVRAILRTKKSAAAATITARLAARLTEIGTLELWCQQVGESRRWQLQFDVRSTAEAPSGAQSSATGPAIVDQQVVETSDALIRGVFGPDGSDSPDSLPKRIATAIELSRADWPPSLLRSQWSTLMDCESSRKRSDVYEARWLNMLGFALRPGFGLAADDWRVEETWKALHGGPVHSVSICEAEWWILWRRIAGGLSRGRQIELTMSVLPSIRREHRQMKSGLGKGVKYASSTHALAEVWRTLGALELADQQARIELGEIILDYLPRPRFEPIRTALLWALGRIGARVPVYGPLNVVLAPDIISGWIVRLDQTRIPQDAVMQLALMQMCRRTSDRYRDVSDDTRRHIVDILTHAGTRAHFVDLVREGGTLDTEEAGLVFGEALPVGLRLV